MLRNFGQKLRPALVIIHGGGWAAGSKSVDVYQKMKAKGAIEYLEVEGGHGVAYAEKLEITDPAIEHFFAEYLHPKK